MVRIFLIHPGSTDFDDQRRIKGTLNIPLNASGAEQVAQLVHDLQDTDIEVVYSSPGQSAEQTAETLAVGLNLKHKRLENLQNLDHGLWHGKLIDEVKQRQPKVYRLWQEHPETICPPEGETLASARKRIQSTMKRLQKKHKTGTIALVVPEPLASILRSSVERRDLGDLWKATCDFGGWDLLEIAPPQAQSV